jgi:hypothetical protein
MEDRKRERTHGWRGFHTQKGKKELDSSLKKYLVEGQF